MALERSVDFQTVGITSSIGVVVDETAGSDIDELLKHADAQMYGVTRNSKTRVAVHRLGTEQGMDHDRAI
jgi:GGDEF domain-containing protein